MQHILRRIMFSMLDGHLEWRRRIENLVKLIELTLLVAAVEVAFSLTHWYFLELIAYLLVALSLGYLLTFLLSGADAYESRLRTRLSPTHAVTTVALVVGIIIIFGGMALLSTEVQGSERFAHCAISPDKPSAQQSPAK